MKLCAKCEINEVTDSMWCGECLNKKEETPMGQRYCANCKACDKRKNSKGEPDINMYWKCGMTEKRNFVSGEMESDYCSIINKDGTCSLYETIGD